MSCVGFKCENKANYLIDGEHRLCFVHFAQLIGRYRDFKVEYLGGEITR